MIFQPASLLDHAVTVGIVIPQVLRQAGPLRSLSTFLKLIFWFVPSATLQLIWTRYFTARSKQTLYIQQLTVSEELTLRLLRWAAVNVHPTVLRAMTDRPVSVSSGGPERTEGPWVQHDQTKKPDIIFYFIHGYAVLSAKFYLEFVLACQSSLLTVGYENPALFNLEYTLAPDKQFPGQLNEALLGYKEVLTAAGDYTKICVGDDSAGGMLTLTLLQELAARKLRSESMRHPDVAVLISPWVTLKTHLHSTSAIDYVQPDTLSRFAELYTGGVLSYQAPASPGSCQNNGIWRAAHPERGYIVTYGDEEGKANDIRYFIDSEKKRGGQVRVLVDEGGVHVVPVISVQFSTTNEKRIRGILSIVHEIRDALA